MATKKKPTPIVLSRDKRGKPDMIMVDTGGFMPTILVRGDSKFGKAMKVKKTH